MSHRLGPVLTIAAPITLGPDTGATPTPGVWTGTFPVDPLAKFVILHCDGTSLGGPSAATRRSPSATSARAAAAAGR